VGTAELAYASIADIAPRLKAGDLSPVELAEACLDRIARLDQHINAFVTVLADSALAEARQAEREIQQGSYRGPLHGIPIAHKDLYYTSGIRTTAGSKVMADFLPDHDATVVEQLRAAGTVLLGKLNMHEFAAGGTNENPYYGNAHNPWHLDYFPGGSSGGSAAALAAGFCLGSTGSDTAGSIRIPSTCCGTTGIKPTYGRVSRFGVVPLSWSLDHAGPMTRNAHDAALMLNALAGFDRRDSATIDRPVEDFTSGLDLGVQGLRLGIPRTYFTADLQPDVERAWRAAIDLLVSLGATPVDVNFSQLDDSVTMGQTIVRAEMTTFHHDWFTQRPDAYSPSMHTRFETGTSLSALDYVRAQRARERVRDELWSALDQADFLVTPTMSTTALAIGSQSADMGSSAALAELTRFTYPFNLSGFPALSIPCGFDGHGLPIGLQLAAGPWQEALLFRVGHAYQQATDWHRRRPRAPFN
jgi:aspartyl-tRNA(Asn)/glutamyl-tRNA(Gln) amidotransferase subunit A